MASIRENTLSGGERTWTVLYRHGGKQTSKTFDALEGDPRAGTIGAADFKTLVDTLGPDRALKAAATSDEPEGITVDELFERWIAWKGETKGGEPIRVETLRTIEDYRRDYGNWIQPWFGHRAAEVVDESDVQEWADHMVTQLARKSALDRHMILSSMYSWAKARSRRLVTHNPCLETEWPKKVKKAPKGTTVPEFDRIVSAARETKKNDDAADLITYLGETGWRFSEGTALPRIAVEDQGDVEVKHPDGSIELVPQMWVTVVQVFRIVDNRQVLVPNAAKSYAAFRRIRLFHASARVVRRRIAGLGPTDLVFTNSRGNPWNQNTFLRTTWPGILAAAGLWQGARVSPTPHWLRHMHVAVLAAAGVPVQEIQRRIGHESITTTIGTYGGMIGDMSDDALERSASIMAGRQNAPTIAPATVVAEIVAGEVAEGLINPVT